MKCKCGFDATICVNCLSVEMHEIKAENVRLKHLINDLETAATEIEKKHKELPTTGPPISFDYTTIADVLLTSKHLAQKMRTDITNLKLNYKEYFAKKEGVNDRI